MTALELSFKDKPRLEATGIERFWVSPPLPTAGIDYDLKSA